MPTTQPTKKRAKNAPNRLNHSGSERVRARRTHGTSAEGVSDATREDQARLLKALVTHDGHISRACKTARVGRSTHYDWLAKDETYPERYQHARQMVLDDLESDLFPRARKSDRLLMFVLESRFPEVYGKKVKVDGAVPVHSLDPEKLKALTDKELDTLIRLSKKVAVRQA